MIKKYKEFVNEGKEVYGRDIINFIKQLSQITDGYQREFYQQMLSDAKIVKCSSIRDIFSVEEIERTENMAEMKECYKNSFLLTVDYGIPDIMYCEGYITYMGIPIEHAFNKIGDKYYDITAELVLGGDVKDDEYVVLGEYTPDEVRKIVLENEYYGGVYNNVLMKRIQENK